MAFKVKINELPSLEKEPQITTSIKENPYKANVEIEKDELVIRPDLAAIYKAKGEKHSKGGIKTYLPDNSFVISDDKSLSLTKEEHDMLELKKGGSLSPSKNTPADVLKRNLDVKHYNKMTSILTNPKKDEFSKRTAAMMLSKYEDVLGRVAYAQEAKKGFPTGLPEFSEDEAPVYNDTIKENIEQQVQYMKKGGYKNPYLPTMADGGKNKLWFQTVQPKPGQIVDNKPLLGRLLGLKPDVKEFNNDMMNLLTFGKSSPNVSAKSVTAPVTSVSPIATASTVGMKPTKLSMPTNDEFTNYYDKSAKTQYTAPNGLKPQDFYKPEVLEYLKGLDKMKGFDNDLGVYQDNTWGKRHQQAFDHFGNDYFFPRRKSTEMGQTVSTPRNTKINMSTINDSKGADPNKIAAKPGETGKQNPWEFSKYQKADMAMSALDAASVRQEFPYRSQIKSPLLENNRVNAQGALNNVDNSIYGAMQSNRGLNPYLAGANSASIFGKGLDSKQQVQNQYDNTNIGIDNQQNQVNNEIQRNDAMFNIGADQQYYRESVQGRTNFDNMQDFTRNRFRENVNRNVEANQILSYNMMTQNNPAHGYNWKDGSFFLTGKNPFNSNSVQNGDIMSQYINKLGLDFDKMTMKERLEFAKIMTRGKTPSLYAKKGGKINPYKK